MAALLNWQRDSAASLFERIQKVEINSPSVNLRDFVNSIKHNLNNILNTHPGTSQSAKELGVMDLNDATSSAVDIYQKIAEIIKFCILNYEPRIIDVNISPLPNEQQPLTLYFYVEATVSFQDYCRFISFNIHLDNDYHYYLDMNNVI